MVLPKGIKVFYGFIGLYVGLIIYLVTNALLFLIYERIPAETPLDPLMYLGFAVMVLVPAWFWILRPVYVHARDLAAAPEEEAGVE